MLKSLEQWICDRCGQVIKEPNQGSVEWIDDSKTHKASGFKIVQLVSLVVVENRFFGIGVQIFLPQLPYNERSLNSQRLSIPPLRGFQR